MIAAEIAPNRCTGCEACVEACPHHVITLVEDAEGFRYPVREMQSCRQCRLCEQVCPGLSEFKRPDRPDLPSVFAARHTDDSVRHSSSSGGVFQALARRTLEQGGVIAGAAFIETARVGHSLARDQAALVPLQGSKYLQSETRAIYGAVIAELREGRPVLFVGTPCQVAGLYGRMPAGADHLLTCDLICHGVPSQRVWRTYLNALEQQHGARARSVSFRDKGAGWRAYRLRVAFENGAEYLSPANHNPFLCGFVQNLYLRPSCHVCPFVGIPRIGDITLGDYWKVERLHPGFSDDRGTSLVLCNTTRGRMAFDACRDVLQSVESPPHAAIATSHCLTKPVPPAKYRARFFDQLGSESVTATIQRNLPRRRRSLRALAAHFLRALKLRS